jgi:hypothetical protein
MGYGAFSEATYTSSKALRSSKGVSDFSYTENAKEVHESLNPRRINLKAIKFLESRDNDGRISTPVLITKDVTGSNYRNAIVVQEKLPELMQQLAAVCQNPQVAVWSNDDYSSVGRNCVQMSEFESDNRIDDSIRNLWLTAMGGSNAGESYDLLVYAAARKTATDSLEKRGKRGYMFMYADEPFFTQVRASEIIDVFGDNAQADIPIDDIIAEAKTKWDITILFPSQSGQARARSQYVKLFGAECVRDLAEPEDFCQAVAAIVKEKETAMEKATAAEADADIYSRTE